MTDKLNPVARLSTLELESFEEGRSYASRDAGLSERLGLTLLGAGYTEVPPGKTACPFHVHHGEDEMFVILSGMGEYRFGGTRYPVQAGDVLGAPIGGADYAHQLWNTGDEPLKYLAISSKAAIDVAEYPDTGKFMVMSKRGHPIGASKFRHMARAEDHLDYFDGDKDYD